MKWDGLHSVAIRPKPKKGGRVSSNTEEISGMVDTGVEGSKNAQALPAPYTQRWTCMRGGAKCNKRDSISVFLLCVITCTDK